MKSFQQIEGNNQSLTFWFGASLILHLLLVQAVNPFLLIEHAPSKKQKTIQLVLTPKRKEQIVPPSNVKESKKVPKTNNLSDKNTLVRKEVIKKGDTQPSQQTAPKKISKPSPKKVVQTPQRKGSPKVRQTGSIFLTKQNQPKDDPKNNLKKEVKKAKDLSEARLNSLSTLTGSVGHNDLLPDIKAADITLLNAKASKYAVFVRRVALQVFSHLKTEIWQGLSYNSARGASKKVTVEALLDKNGNLISAKELDSSNSNNFDQALKNAVNRGAWDNNPPTSALTADGNYLFIFQAQIRARKAPNRRGYGFRLVLGTGLL